MGLFFLLSLIVIGFVTAPTKPTEVVNIVGKVPGIRCPFCRWEPKATDRWFCNPHCGGPSWNPFTQGGICPSCDRRCQIIECHCCHSLSYHGDWYEEDDRPSSAK